MLTFENKDYREGWLEGVVRTVQQDLMYIEDSLSELKTFRNDVDKAQAIVSTMIGRTMVMCRLVEDAVRRIDELKGMQDRQNALKRLAAMNKRGKASELLAQISADTPLFLSQARVEDHAEMDKEAGITPSP